MVRISSPTNHNEKHRPNKNAVLLPTPPHQPSSSYSNAFLQAKKLLTNVDEKGNLPDPRSSNKFFLHINFEEISEQEFFRLRDLLNSLLSRVDKRPWSANGVRKGGPIRGACSRRGKATTVGSKLMVKNRLSDKCQCLARYSLFRNGALIFAPDSHNCPIMSTDEMKSKPFLFRIANSPSLKSNFIKKAVSMLTNDESLRPRQLARQIEGDWATEGSSSSSSYLPISFTEGIIRDAKKVVVGGISLADSMAALLRELSNNHDTSSDRRGATMKYKVLEDEEIKEDGVVKAIHIHDTCIAPADGTKISVVTSDVTFGLTSAVTGFRKWSFCTALTPSHEAYVLTYSAIKKEDSSTFLSEFKFLISIYPDLERQSFVLLVDGDKAKLLAARTTFRNCSIILCLFHSSENIKKHFGPWIRKEQVISVNHNDNDGKRLHDQHPAPVNAGDCSSSSFSHPMTDGTVDNDNDEQQSSSNNEKTDEKNLEDVDRELKRYLRRCDSCQKWRQIQQITENNLHSISLSFSCNDCSIPESMEFQDRNFIGLALDNHISHSSDNVPLQVPPIGTAGKVGGNSTTTEPPKDDILPRPSTGVVDSNYSTGKTEHDYVKQALNSSQLSTKSWFTLWKYIRKGETRLDVRRRLDEVVERFPKSKSYVQFLWSSVELWALYETTWSLTFGFQSTAVQEGVHWSLKSGLLGNELPLHLVPAYIRKIMTRRTVLKYKQKKAVSKTLNRLLEDSKERGFKQFCDTANTYLTDEGLSLILIALDDSFAYNAEFLNVTDLESVLPYIEFRGPSARRLKCLIQEVNEMIAESNCSSTSGSHQADVDHRLNPALKLIKVTSNRCNGTVDIVVVNENGGGIACSAPQYMNWGIPSKHVMAAFRNGLMQLNVAKNLHPIYQQHFVCNMSHEDIKSLLTVTPDRFGGNDISMQNSEFKSSLVTNCNWNDPWNWSVVVSERRWNSLQYDSMISRYSSTSYNDYDHERRSIASSYNNNTKYTIDENLQKEWYKLKPILKSNVEERELFFTYLGGVAQRSANRSRIHATARSKALCINNSNSSISEEKEEDKDLKAAQLIDDGCKKRKRSKKNNKAS